MISPPFLEKIDRGMRQLYERIEDRTYKCATADNDDGNGAAARMISSRESGTVSMLNQAQVLLTS